MSSEIQIVESHHVLDVVKELVAPETETEGAEYRLIFLFACLSKMSVVVKDINEAFLDLTHQIYLFQWILLDGSPYIQLNEYMLISNQEARVEFFREDREDEEDETDGVDSDDEDESDGDDINWL